jgi:MFS family permease
MEKTKMHISNFRGWRAGIGSILIVIGAIFPITSLQIYIMPLCETLQTDVTRISFIFSVFSIGGLITASALLGPLMRTVQAKFLVVIGGFTTLLFFLILAFSKNLYLIYLGSFIQGLGNMLCGFPIAQITITRWFEKGRSTMMSACSIGLSLASTILFPVLGSCMAAYGYQMTALGEGGILGGLIILAGLSCISEAPERYGLKPIGAAGQGQADDKQTEAGAEETSPPASGLTRKQILAAPTFWGVFVVVLFSTLCSQIVVSHGANYYGTTGLTVTQTSFVLSAYSFMVMIWVLLYGIVNDRTTPLVSNVLFSTVGASGFLLVSVWSGMGLAGALLAAATFGFISPICTLFGPTVGVRLLGAREAASIIGWVNAAASIGAIIGPLLAGVIFDAAKSYTVVFVTAGALALIVLVLAVVLCSKKTEELMRRKEAGSVSP